MSEDPKLNETLENLRADHQLRSLDLEDCDPDPIEQFDIWLKDAISSQCDEPNAFVLSTIREGRPRARVLLLKGVHEGKLIFYTNFSSAKGQELESNNFVALTFLWLPLQRQVRIEGRVSRVDARTSDEYFKKRPRGSQLGAIASPQSKKISSRSELENLFADVEKKFAQIEIIPRPENWGGYQVEADYFEFWQGRTNRMHDRITYEPVKDGWVKSRLAP